MRVKKVNYNKKDSIMIYITEQEKANEKIQEEIKAYKEQYKDVSIFTSGNNSIENVLTKIIQEHVKT